METTFSVQSIKEETKQLFLYSHLLFFRSGGNDGLLKNAFIFFFLKSELCVDQTDCSFSILKKNVVARIDVALCSRRV